MRLMSERVINEQVALGLEKLYPVMLFKAAPVRATLGFAMWVILYRRLLHNDVSYRMYCFAKVGVDGLDGAHAVESSHAASAQTSLEVASPRY
jgi:hypothetical protein